MVTQVFVQNATRHALRLALRVNLSSSGVSSTRDIQVEHSVADALAKLKHSDVPPGERVIVASVKRRALKNKETALLLIDVSIEEAGPDPCVTLKHRLRGQLVGSKMSLSLEGHPYEALFPEQSWAKGAKTYDGKYVSEAIQLHIHYRFLRGPAGDDNVEFTISEMSSRIDVSASLARQDSIGGLLSAEDLALTATQLDEVYENQRGTGLSGPSSFSARGLFPQERGAYSTAHGQFRVAKEYIDVPSRSWEWVWDQWKVDTNEPCDEDGWMYAFNWSSPFKDSCSAKTFVRRRKWVRLRRRVRAQEDKERPAEVQVNSASLSTVDELSAAMARTDFTDTQRLALVLSFLENNEAQRSLTLEQARLVISKLLFDTTRVEFCKKVYPEHVSREDMVPLLNELAFFSHRKQLAVELGIDLHALTVHGDEHSSDEE